MQKAAVVLCVAAMLMLAGICTPVLAQEAEPMMEGSEMEWVWGEVVATDVQNGTVTVKYIDYDTDVENQMIISLDENTGFENVGSLAEIKPQDSVSIDYEIAVDGSAIARMISIESMPADMMPIKEIDFPEQVQEEMDVEKQM